MDGFLLRTQNAIQTPFDNTSNGFIATDVQAAIEEAKIEAQLQRYNIIMQNNGNLSNNQRLSYSELLGNTPVILPKDCILRELTFSNIDTNSDARFDIYRRSTPASTPSPTGATLVQTWTITNKLTDRLTDMDHDFLAGEEILIIYTSTGNTPSDVCLVAFFLST